MNFDAGAGDMGTDYGDFRYQTIKAEAFTTGEGNVNIEYSASFEPLEGVGGLQTNEVAELVYLETQVYVEPEEEDGGDQAVSTSVEDRGAIVINDTTPGGWVENAQLSSNDGKTFLDDLTNSDSTNIIRYRASKDEILQPFSAQAGFPFDDGTNGLGGGSVNNANVFEKNYRNLTGRGPVLDANDDIVVTGSLNAGDLISRVGAIHTCHMVWDVAETDDAGRAFSVPSDD